MAKNPPAIARDTSLILVQEDPTCCGAAKPMSHSYLSPCFLEPLLCNKRSTGTTTEEMPQLSAARESQRVAMRTQKYINTIFKIVKFEMGL